LLKEYIWRHGLIPDTTGNIIGHSKVILMALRSARRMANSQQVVLIRGASGTGKGLVARYIHANSRRCNAPFIPVNLGGTNPHLYESLLFGHVKGAFTGATDHRKGRIEEADKGILFFDEIAGIPTEVQYGLLHVLEDKQVTPVGSNKALKIDVQFISATNEDVEAKAAAGQGFRSDLLYRLREGGTLHLPPLSQRKDDIPMLVEHFVRQAEKQFSGAQQRNIAADSIKKLSDFKWPGNVRELRQQIFEAVSENLDVEHLVPNHIRLPEIASVTQKIQEDQINRLEPLTELDDLLKLIAEHDFSLLKREDLTGRLEEIELTCRLFSAHYLKATLETTLTPVEGEIQITPAAKMATGEIQIKTSKAADIIKRLLKGLDLTDPKEIVLLHALERALDLRPARK
jgi:DNA-binding NtrC family response regulator